MKYIEGIITEIISEAIIYDDKRMVRYKYILKDSEYTTFMLFDIDENWQEYIYIGKKILV